MSPRKQYKKKLAKDIRGCDIEVMLQRADGHVTIQLEQSQPANPPFYSRIDSEAHILLHIFLPGHGSTFSYLEPHLRGLVVHKSTKRRRKLSSSTRCVV